MHAEPEHVHSDELVPDLLRRVETLEERTTRKPSPEEDERARRLASACWQIDKAVRQYRAARKGERPWAELEAPEELAA